MDYTMPGFPVHHQLSELTQTHVHRVGDAIQPSHPLSSPSPPSSVFPSIRVFSSELVLCIRWPKYWSFSFNISPSNEHPRLISFRMDCLTLNPTFHTQGPPISSEPPSVASWLNHTKNLQEDFLPPPSPPAASSQHSRQCDPATTHQITSLFCPKPSHHPPPSSH